LIITFRTVLVKPDFSTLLWETWCMHLFSNHRVKSPGPGCSKEILSLIWR
jgi:hypothetical protein